MAKDLYKILGVSKGASGDEIQKAYRESARRYHPDLNPDDTSAKEKFQEVQSAYEILNDPEKRQMYDRYGSSFEQMNPGGGGPRGAGPNPFQDVDLGEIFGSGQGGAFADLFKHFAEGPAGSHQRRARQRGPQKGSDLHHSVLVSFHDAVLGGEVPLPILDKGGSSQKTITIKIPAGIGDGKKIRLRGQGNRGTHGGQPGDLIVTVNVGSHPHFRRNGNNLEISVPITLTEAAVGGKIDVPTPKGTISVSVPPRAQSGQRLRIRGMGVETQAGEKGDLFVELQISLPATLNDEQIELLKQIESARSEDPRASLKW